MKRQCHKFPAFILAVSLFGASAVGVQAQWHYYYFKDPQPLGLYTEQIAIQQSEQATSRVEVEGLKEFGIPSKAIRRHTLEGWLYAEVPSTMKTDGQVRDLVERIATTGDVDFVSPILEDQLGQALMITPYLHVGFREEVKTLDAEAILDQFGAGLILERDWSRMKGVYRLKSSSRDGFEVLEIANALAQHPDVIFAEPELIAKVRKTYIPNDPFFTSLWGIHNTGQSGGTANMDMDGPEAWDITTGVPSIVVVVLDTGTQLDHPDLNLAPGEDFTGQNGQGGPVNECDNHGTYVAGCVSSIIDNSLGVVGIAPDCRVAPARVFVSNVPCSNFGSVSSTWVINALDWAFQTGAKITTASIGMPVSSALTTKYQWAKDNGITHFTSSGNSGAGSIGYPGNIDPVNAIGAIDRNGNRAGFSQYGPDLAYSAPGVSIMTTARGGGYGTVDGTSFASPYAAGVAALVLSVAPSLTPSLLEQILQETAKDLGAAGYDQQFGWGLLSAFNAVQAVNAAPRRCELDKLTAADAAAESEFGRAVAIGYDVLVVGASMDDEMADDAGAAYVYRRSGTDWNYEAKLTASSPATVDRFGYSVAVDGDVVVVGAYLKDTAVVDSGSAHVFRWDGSTWEEEEILVASDADGGDRFGFSVSVSGDVILVGAYGDNDAGSDSGSAYVFRWNGSSWIEEEKLTATGAAGGDRFGWSVSVSGGVAAVGSPLDDDAGSSSGSAYVFAYDGADWTDQTKITASNQAGGDNFGYSVSIDRDMLLVGAQYADPVLSNDGAAYFFEFGGSSWAEIQKLRAFDGMDGDGYGSAVSLAGDLAIIGTHRNDAGGADAGAAYTYRWNSSFGYWGGGDKLLASDAFAGDNFGRTVAIRNGYALVGAPADDDAGSASGSAYLSGVATDCNLNGAADICDIRDNISEDVDDDGVPDDCCPFADAPLLETQVITKARYFSFVPGNAGQPVAFRLTVEDLPSPFSAFNGTEMWIAAPRLISEISGENDDTPPNFWGANLSCAPVYSDWTEVDVVHVFDREVVPGGVYRIQAIAQDCDIAVDSWYSVHAEVETTALWGDFVGSCSVPECEPPDGAVDFVDISATVDKFRNLANATVKSRVDLAEVVPDARVNFLDISLAVDAFRSLPYPYETLDGWGCD